jgi:hypothetical protein
MNFPYTISLLFLSMKIEKNLEIGFYQIHNCDNVNVAKAHFFQSVDHLEGLIYTKYTEKLELKNIHNNDWASYPLPLE